MKMGVSEVSILYRAVWSDAAVPDRSAMIDQLKQRITAWVQECDDAPPLVEGESQFDLSKDRRRTVTLRFASEDAFEVVSTDRDPGETTEWVTTIRVLSDTEGIHALVELSMSAEDLARRVAVGRPRIVHEMLEAAWKPTLGGSRLPTEALELPPNGVPILIEMLARADRSLPIIVCAEPSRENDGSWLDVARKIAARTEGVAAVVTLRTPAVEKFKQSFGQLAIWNGGIRVYAPGIVTSESEGWKHRYYLHSRIEMFEAATIDRIVYSVAQLSTRRRIPAVFKIFGDSAGLPAGALDDMISVKALLEEREEWETKLELARANENDLNQELMNATGHLKRLGDQLLNQGLAELYWGTKFGLEDSEPDQVQDISEAVLGAQAYLDDWISLPDSAIRNLEDLDTAPEAFNWGNTTWRGLRALAAYAEARAGGWDAGGFWEWCKSGSPLAWPATRKKLSMTESEGVRNGGKFKGTRDFEVDKLVDSSGRVTMLAHLKISEGGGSLAPRVYFYDDTGGATGKVHIGLVGPHYLVPNQSTN